MKEFAEFLTMASDKKNSLYIIFNNYSNRQRRVTSPPPYVYTCNHIAYKCFNNYFSLSDILLLQNILFYMYNDKFFIEFIIMKIVSKYFNIVDLNIENIDPFSL